MKKNYELIEAALELLKQVDTEEKFLQRYLDDFEQILEDLEYIADQLRVKIVRKGKK